MRIFDCDLGTLLWFWKWQSLKISKFKLEEILWIEVAQYLLLTSCNRDFLEIKQFRWPRLPQWLLRIEHQSHFYQHYKQLSYLPLQTILHHSLQFALQNNNFHIRQPGNLYLTYGYDKVGHLCTEVFLH